MSLAVSARHESVLRRPFKSLAATARTQSALSLGGFGLSAVALLALLPFLIAEIGASQYGAWVLTGGLVGSVALFDFGASFAASRWVARSFVAARRDAAEALTVALGLATASGVIVLVSGLVLADTWESVLGVPGTATATRLSAIALVPALVARVFQSALEGAGLVAISRLIQSAAGILFTAAAVLVAHVFSDDLRALGLLLLVHSVAAAATSGLAVAYAWGWHMPLAAPRGRTLVDLSRYAAGAQASSIASTAVEPIGRALLGVVGGPASVAIADIAMRLRGQWFAAAVVATRPLLPRVGQAPNKAAGLAFAERAWREALSAILSTGLFAAALALFAIPRLFDGLDGEVGVLAALAVVLWLPSAIATIPYTVVVLHGRARDIVIIQSAISVFAIAFTAGTVWWLGPWSPILGYGLAAAVGARIILSFARRAAGTKAFSVMSHVRAMLRGIGEAVGAAVLLSLLVLTSTPALVAFTIAMIVWFALAAQSLRRLLQSLT